MVTNEITLPDERIIEQIYNIRGQKVMVDRDLAALYGVETRVLKQAVKRNINRFPPDFMFEMNKTEFEIWRSQFVMSKEDQKGLRHAPFCFTEQGVSMLSCVLNSDRSIQVNIRIIRIFTRMRQMLMDATELKLELEKMKKKLDNHDQNIELLFRYLDELVDKRQGMQERVMIGFKL
jgi:hypothetical protein